jgi:hypothetical protein
LTYKTLGTAKYAEVIRDRVFCGLECGLKIIPEIWCPLLHLSSFIA